MTRKPVTLGDKLAAFPRDEPKGDFRAGIQDTLSSLLNFSLVSGGIALQLWVLTGRVELGVATALTMIAVAIAVWFATVLSRRPRRRGPRHLSKKNNSRDLHPLLKNDQLGFMANLRLSVKTVIIDGSNIYHFGHKYGMPTRPLAMIANQLRDEGYRIVCFFDANIFYTLIELGIFPRNQSHTYTLLGSVFELNENEIYVVPGGVQADQYILDSLKFLPVSFAITNDRFRDYVDRYPSVMTDNQWRKGVVFSNGEIHLHQHKFQKPLLLPAKTTP